MRFQEKENLQQHSQHTCPVSKQLLFKPLIIVTPQA
jgi:hypothetical protein